MISAQWRAASADWATLWRQCGASFFLSPDWVETWLETFGASLDAEVAVFRRGHQPIGACVLARRIHWRKIVPMRRVYLNCAGEPDDDDTCIEYNRLLCLPGEEESTARALLDHLSRESWDELSLNGMETRPPFLGTAEIRQRPSWYVDLSALRASNAAYETSLSSNVRSQIRRSIHLFEQAGGPLALHIASSLDEANRFLTELADLHQKSWPARGKPGVFASARFNQFHRRLIERCFAKGSIQLLRAAAGDQTIGLLYCLQSAGRVYFYQSGFAYQQDNRLKPGLVTHFLAVNHYLNHQPAVSQYDFLAGDSQYKRSLAKNQRTLEWIVAQRPTMRVRAVELLDKARRLAG